MENTLVVTSISNEKIADQLKKAMLNNTEIMEAVSSQEQGYIDIFIRKGNVSKLLYPKFHFDSMKINFDEIDEDFQLQSDKKFQVPKLVYRRFIYLLSTAILYTPYMEHGHLRFAFEFREMENDLWQEKFSMDFIAEKPFRNGELIKEYE